MKHLKLYENFDYDPFSYPNKIEVGDYVILNLSKEHYHRNEYLDFINNSIGEVICVFDHYNIYNRKLEIKYENVPENIKIFFHSGSDDPRSFSRNSIEESPIHVKYLSKDKEDLEYILEGELYNL